MRWAADEARFGKPRCCFLRWFRVSKFDFRIPNFNDVRAPGIPGLVLALMIAAFGCPETRGKVVLDAPLVVTQVPREATPKARESDPEGLVRPDWFEGARIVVVSPEGRTRILSRAFFSACDPNVSFDGTHLVFAGKKGRQSRWRIWEIGVDGRNLRPITSGDGDARSPIYLSTLFTLDSPEPWFTIAYVGREAIIHEGGQPSSSSLYTVKLDGTELRRLTFNPSHSFDPFQMWDGRVLYAAEHYPLEPTAGAGRVGLYAIHMVGTDGELYGGETGRRIQHMPCATDQGLVVSACGHTGAAPGTG